MTLTFGWNMGYHWNHWHVSPCFIFTFTGFANQPCQFRVSWPGNGPRCPVLGWGHVAGPGWGCALHEDPLGLEVTRAERPESPGWGRLAWGGGVSSGAFFFFFQSGWRTRDLNTFEWWTYQEVLRAEDTSRYTCFCNMVFENSQCVDFMLADPRNVDGFCLSSHSLEGLVLRDCFPTPLSALRSARTSLSAHSSRSRRRKFVDSWGRNSIANAELLKA